MKLKDVWDKLPNLPHTKKYLDEKSGLKMYEICGKKYQETSRVDYVLERLIAFEEKYGQRARDAAENKNVDFKAVSYAVRYALQLEELFETGDIRFPLKDAYIIKQIKLGELDYTSVVAPYLDQVIEGVEQLVEKSHFPQVADRNPWDKFIKIYHKYVVELEE